MGYVAHQGVLAGVRRISPGVRMEYVGAALTARTSVPRAAPGVGAERNRSVGGLARYAAGQGSGEQVRIGGTCVIVAEGTLTV
jgi:hypothetical protein